MADRPLVVIEVPWSGMTHKNAQKEIVYLRGCLRDSLAHNELPWSAHGLLHQTMALYDSDEEQLAEAVLVARQMVTKADCVIFYIDHRYTQQMRDMATWASMQGKPILRRTLYS